MTQLTAHFSLEEMTTTQVRSVSNQPAKEMLPELVKTAQMLEGCREVLSAAKGRPVSIHVNSAYRSPAVNTIVGGSPTSDHCKAAAADITAKDFGTPREIALFLIPRMKALGIGQLIWEGTWIHLSRIAPSNKANAILTATFPNGKAVYSVGVS